MLLWLGALLYLLFGFSGALAETGALNSDQRSLPSYQELEHRIQALEKRVNAESISEEDERDVKSYLNTNLLMGGFFDTALTATGGQPDRGTQTAASNTAFGLNLGGEFSDHLRFASQIITSLGLNTANPNTDPRYQVLASAVPRGSVNNYTFVTVLTQAYLDWSTNETLSAQIGMGYVPFGIVFQEFEPVLFVRRGGPQLLSNNVLVFASWEGIRLYGQAPVSDGHIGYDLYTFSPFTNTTVIGVGERLWWHSQDEKLHLGLSSQTGKREVTFYDTLGADAKIQINRMTLTSEIVKSFGQGIQPFSYYIEPDYDLNKWNLILYLFGDYIFDPIGMLTTSPTPVAPYQKWQYGGGLNWLPTSFTRFRFGLTMNDYVGISAHSSPNYWSFDLSAGVAF